MYSIHHIPLYSYSGLISKFISYHLMPSHVISAPIVSFILISSHLVSVSFVSSEKHVVLVFFCTCTGLK